MLVLSRKVNEAIVVSETITIRVLAVMGGKVRLGIEAPRDLPILREELLEPVVTKRITDPFLPSKTPSPG